MKVIIQRVNEASVSVHQELIAEIGNGYMLLVGISEQDDQMIVDKLASKIVNLRIFEDENQKMNNSILDIQGEILSISQFTLYADCKKGNRPSFTKAAKPGIANELYERFNEKLREHVKVVKTGIFGEDMKVQLINDGPVSIVLDSEEI